MKRISSLASLVGLLLWPCAAAAQSQRLVLLVAPDPIASTHQRRLSEHVRREVSRQLSAAQSGSSTVSLELTWRSVPAGSDPGPWIDEPCPPQPSGSPDTPPVLTETCGGCRGTAVPRKNLLVVAHVQARECKKTIGPVRASEKEAQRDLANGIAQAVAKLDRVATCRKAGWRP